ncbi:hypothetical protein KEJ51_09145 [Candidatus Bathyarchaeota archaeon]|nr:hypothetical protein [Candidatus Bathyarchaeota archaeon]
MGSASSKILIVPNLKTSSVKASRIIQSGEYVEKIFLPEPEGLEPWIKAYGRERISYEDFVGRVRDSGLIPEPLESWLYTFEPILMGISQVLRQNKALDIFCYKDAEGLERASRFSSEIALLTYRSNVSGRINIDDWIHTVSEYVVGSEDVLLREAQRIIATAGDSGNIIISGLAGKELKRLLSGSLNIQLQCVEKFYHFTPIEILQTVIVGGNIDRCYVESLVRCHLEYVNRYVLRSWNRDVAYYRWVYDKIPHLRSCIREFEIEELKVL